MANWFFRTVSGELSANNILTKSFRRTISEQLHILVTLPQSHQKFTTQSPLSAIPCELLTQCFGELNGLPHVCLKLLLRFVSLLLKEKVENLESDVCFQRLIQILFVKLVPTDFVPKSCVLRIPRFHQFCCNGNHEQRMVHVTLYNSNKYFPEITKKTACLQVLLNSNIGCLFYHKLLFVI